MEKCVYTKVSFTHNPREVLIVVLSLVDYRRPFLKGLFSSWRISFGISASLFPCSFFRAFMDKSLLMVIVGICRCYCWFRATLVTMFNHHMNYYELSFSAIISIHKHVPEHCTLQISGPPASIILVPPGFPPQLVGITSAKLGKYTNLSLLSGPHGVLSLMIFWLSPYASSYHYSR